MLNNNNNNNYHPNINIPAMRPAHLSSNPLIHPLPPNYHHIMPRAQQKPSLYGAGQRKYDNFHKFQTGTTTTFNGYTNITGQRNLPPIPAPRRHIPSFNAYHHQNNYNNNNNNNNIYHQNHYNNRNTYRNFHRYNNNNIQNLPSLLNIDPYHAPNRYNVRSFNHAQQYHPHYTNDNTRPFYPVSI